MKEYLDKDYILRKVKRTSGDNHVPKDWIEVPQGCNIITTIERCGSIIYFHWKEMESDDCFLKDEQVWSNNFGETCFDYVQKNEGDAVVIWQRNKPQKKKEYLNPCRGGGYELSDFPICEDSIEVPDGAEWAKLWDKGGSYECIEFYKGKNEFFSASRKEWMRGADQSTDKPGQPAYIIWQRDKTESVPRTDELNVTTWESQIGGSHYKDYAIQPLEFALANNLDAAQHAVVKYVMRHKDKNGIEDLKKAKHYIDLMIEHYY